MSRCDVGVIGMAVMGRNLALNIARHGFKVAVFNRTRAVTEEVAAAHPGELEPFLELADFVAALERPRRIVLMVKAGAPVDAMLDALLPLLAPGDVVVDGGNSHFQDTIRRERRLREAGVHFIGTGISGGEEGALHGPSIMPGGPAEAYALVAPVFEAIAARAPDGTPCVAHLGPDGAGHYVKMVHNGIEYGDMQLIAESYALLKGVLGAGNAELADIYAEWNRGELDSYLIGITAAIFRKRDERTGQPLIDLVLDRAAQKGTGKWTSQSALDLGVPLSLITEAVFARLLSALKDERVAASKLLTGPQTARFQGDRAAFVEKVRRALYLGKLVSYAQGFAQLRAAATAYHWPLDHGTIAAIWRGGCIIRARFLEAITAAFRAQPELPNLLLAEDFRKVACAYQDALREVVGTALAHGIAVPCLSMAAAYYDGYRSAWLPANLIQAQRDCFGAHTFERIDQPGSFHVAWE
ncbi:MAG: NADP-dependent phosphogluconate dehydrogenase [Fulvimonas sp.]|jgi:6-phosphogluconate dehydrogenase|nr:NADP-dependent phosphogluconate dehydrogenase [Fulvimonas sp.]